MKIPFMVCSGEANYTHNGGHERTHVKEERGPEDGYHLHFFDTYISCGNYKVASICKSC